MDQILTGRSNNRDCINGALPCCQENPAPTCSQGVHGGLPWSEFTVAKAAKKSKLGDYATIQIGKVGPSCVPAHRIWCAR